METKKIRIKQKKQLVTTKKIKQKGKLSCVEKKVQSITTILQLAIETKGKCYMLSFNTPDGRTCKINDIIAELVKYGYLSAMEPVLKNSILFISAYNLCPLNKFINKTFPNLKFVLVRLNRSSYPALKYCY